VKIVELRAENVKRLKAVRINPNGTMQVITGRNAQGKSSVLDAIWLALGGGAAARETTRPIRDGEDHASVSLTLSGDDGRGDLIVTRTWTGGKTTLTVMSEDGAKFPSPQGVLDALIGRIAFDPLEFTRRSARDQVAALLDLVDLDVDLDELARKRAGAFDQRTEVGRTSKALEGQLVGLGDVEDAPEGEVSASALIAEIRAAQEMAASQASDRARRELLAEDVRDRTCEIEDLQAALEQKRALLVEAQARVQGHAEVPDVAALEAALSAAEDTNRAVRRNAQRADVAGRLHAAREAYQSFSDTIAAIDRTKATALAKAKFPVEGLAFDDTGVTFQGVPFSQASSAEQIRVSLAMAMALNPKLRVIRIMDGSLLDQEGLALIADMAEGQDYQVLIERVSDGSGVGIVIEDGSVA
jgi:hypothetical protein